MAGFICSKKHMKHLITAAVFTGLSFVALSQPLNRTFQIAGKDPNLLGHATIAGLQQSPFQEWYQEEYEGYEVNDSLIASMVLPDSITIFMGTWCGDSRREVPRFIKILEAADFDLEKLAIICLNTGFQNYKQAPERQERGMDIHRVPTFVFQDSAGADVGRIVEEPVVSLEQDLIDVLSGKPYDTYYPVANDLIRRFKEGTVEELREQLPTLAEAYKEQSVNVAELNTYGYVLWTSFNLMKAELVFELNTLIYPEEMTPLITLAQFKANMGKRDDALAAYESGVKIDPEDQRLEWLKAALE